MSLTDYAAHGETILYSESALLAYPQNLIPEQVAAANTGLFTAYFALVELACLKPDQQVVVSAAGSSMGFERAKCFISDGLAAGRFSPKIDRAFVGLDEYSAAHRYMQKDARIGKVVISLGGLKSNVSSSDR